MDGLMWRIKQFFRKAIPFAIIGGIVWGGYGYYKQGVFRRGVVPGLSIILHRFPYFGSRFKHYQVGNEYSYRPAAKHRATKRRHGRRHHTTRRHRRHR